MYKFKQVFEISAAFVKEQVINQGKTYFFFLCDVMKLYEASPPLTPPHPVISVTDHQEKHKEPPTP